MSHSVNVQIDYKLSSTSIIELEVKLTLYEEREYTLYEEEAYIEEVWHKETDIFELLSEEIVEQLTDIAIKQHKHNQEEDEIS
jgi:hypothetical protein